MAEVPVQDTKTMTKTVVHLMQGDVSGLVEDAVDLGFLPPDVDRAALTPILQKIFDAAQLQAEFRNILMMIVLEILLNFDKDKDGKLKMRIQYRFRNMNGLTKT